MWDDQSSLSALGDGSRSPSLIPSAITKDTNEVCATAPQTAVSEHDEKSCIAVLQVLDYSEQMAGVSDDDVKILMMRGRSLRFPRMNYEYH